MRVKHEFVNHRTVFTTSFQCKYSQFHNIHHFQHGGAIFLGIANCVAEFYTSTFDHCSTTTATSYGGAVCVDKSVIDALSCCFIHCSAIDNGGAVSLNRVTSIYTGSSVMQECYFCLSGREDTAEDTTVYMRGVTVELSFANCTRNIGKLGGVTIISSSVTSTPSTTVKFTTFVDEKMSMVLNIMDGTFYGERVNFVNCEAPALRFRLSGSYTVNSFVFVNGCTITLGGGTVTINNCAFSEPPTVKGGSLIGDIGQFTSELPAIESHCHFQSRQRFARTKLNLYRFLFHLFISPLH